MQTVTCKGCERKHRVYEYQGSCGCTNKRDKKNGGRLSDCDPALKRHGRDHTCVLCTECAKSCTSPFAKCWFLPKPDGGAYAACIHCQARRGSSVTSSEETRTAAQELLDARSSVLKIGKWQHVCSGKCFLPPEPVSEEQAAPTENGTCTRRKRHTQCAHARGTRGARGVRAPRIWCTRCTRCTYGRGARGTRMHAACVAHT